MVRRTSRPDAPANAKGHRKAKAPLRNPKAKENLRPQPMPIEERRKIKWSYEDTAAQMAEIEARALQGASEVVLFAHCRMKFGIGASRVRRLYAIIQERWKTEDEKQRRFWKSKAIRQLEGTIALARNGVKKEVTKGKKTQVVWDLKPNLPAAIRGMELLSRIQGTQAPVEVNLNVQVSDVLINVIANMTSEEVQASLQRYREDRELAEKARSGLLLGTGTAAE